MLFHWKRSLESQLAEMDGETVEEFSAAEFADPADTNLLHSDETLFAVMREIAKRYPGRPLIAYGSRIAGNADPHSDVDMLAIEYDRNAAPNQETVNSHGVEVDLTRVGFNILLKGIKGRSKNNNNWFLSALRQCCVYGDRDGDARRLRAVAQDVWSEGPPAWTPRQLRLGRGALSRLQDSTKKLVERAETSPEAAKLARMRCDQLVAHSVYQFYCVRRRWTTSLHRLVERCRNEYPEFYALWLEYVSSVDAEGAFDAARRMVEAVHRDLPPPVILHEDGPGAPLPDRVRGAAPEHVIPENFLLSSSIKFERQKSLDWRSSFGHQLC